MNVAMLKTLGAIVDRGSFAAAAREVGCTPSAVSLQVKQLEAWFGQLLFDRSARIARPTPFALEAATVARDVAARLEALRTRPAARVSGRVRLGAIASVQTANLPQALRIVRDRHPDLRVEVSLADRATRNGRAVTPTSDATKTPAVVAPPLIAMSVIGRMVAESK